MPLLVLWLASSQVWKAVGVGKRCGSGVAEDGGADAVADTEAEADADADTDADTGADAGTGTGTGRCRREEARV